MPANDKSTQDYFGHAIILSDTHIVAIHCMKNRDVWFSTVLCVKERFS